MKKIFFDTEFTGLRKDTSLVSIGLISDCGKTFYAELNDYDKSQVDDWLKTNVISKLSLSGNENSLVKNGENWTFYGNLKELMPSLLEWLVQFETDLQMWSDCLAYDWVLFNDIFGGAFNIPKCVNYIPQDICTLFHVNNIDPDINREEFAYGKSNKELYAKKHTSMFDAIVIKDCYNKFKIK